MVHMLRTFHRAVRRMAPAMRKRYADQLQALLQLRQTLPADGETQLRLWREEAVAAGDPHRGARGAWRRLVLHMWERGVPQDTNRLEGRVKPRYRLMRGFHRVAGAQHALALLADVLA